MHKEICPIIRAAYCSICSIYGHFTDECTDYTAISNRKPKYLELLIPYNLRKEHNITSILF